MEVISGNSYFIKASKEAVTATFKDSTPLFIGILSVSLQSISTSGETPSLSFPRTKIVLACGTTS